MEILVAALGVVVQAILSLPVWELAKSDSKKARLARTLLEAEALLSRLHSRGGRFLDALETYCADGGRQDPRDLAALAGEQVDDIERLKRVLELGSDTLFDSRAEEVRVSPSLERTLDLYGVASGMLHSVVGIKESLLYDFVRYFREISSQDTLQLPIVVRDSVGRHRVLSPPEAYRVGWDHDLLREYPVEVWVSPEGGDWFDLAERVGLETYFSAARERLEELESMRHRLREFLKQHFEPHHLV